MPTSTFVPGVRRLLVIDFANRSDSCLHRIYRLLNNITKFVFDAILTIPRFNDIVLMTSDQHASRYNMEFVLKGFVLTFVLHMVFYKRSLKIGGGEKYP